MIDKLKSLFKRKPNPDFTKEALDQAKTVHSVWFDEVIVTPDENERARSEALDELTAISQELDLD
jgi:hypothetical protein